MSVSQERTLDEQEEPQQPRSRPWRGAAAAEQGGVTHKIGHCIKFTDKDAASGKTGFFKL